MPNTRTARLARWQIWLLCLSGVLLWLSGAAWLLLHYYGQTAGEFGPTANPLEPWMMRVHGLALIPALLGIGGLLVAHIPKGWQFTAQRVAGVVLGGLLVLLVASGYLLYYVADEDVRGWTTIVHWSIGLAVPVIFIWHYINGLRARKRPGVRRVARTRPSGGRKSQ